MHPCGSPQAADGSSDLALMRHLHFLPPNCAVLPTCLPFCLPCLSRLSTSACTPPKQPRRFQTTAWTTSTWMPGVREGLGMGSISTPLRFYGPLPSTTVVWSVCPFPDLPLPPSPLAHPAPPSPCPSCPQARLLRRDGRPEGLLAQAQVWRHFCGARLHQRRCPGAEKHQPGLVRCVGRMLRKARVLRPLVLCCGFSRRPTVAAAGWPAAVCMDGSVNMGAVKGAVDEFLATVGLTAQQTTGDGDWPSWMARKP